MLPGSALGATIDVPADWPTIQAAVAAAGRGDTIRVAPGNYVVPIRIEGDKAGLTIEAANPNDPPVLHGVPHVKHDGFRVDGVDGVTIRNIVVLDAYDGVRLNHVNGALVVGVRIERNALGVRVNQGSNNRVIGSTIIDSNVEQGILFDTSPGGVAWDNVVVGSDSDGVRLVRSPCSDLRDLVVLDSRGDGIQVHSSPGTRIHGSVVEGNRNNGIRVSSSPFLEFVGNRATDNGNNGLWIYRSPPFRTIDDVVAQGNQASGNGRHDFVVTPRNSPVDDPSCGPLPTTTTLTTTTRPTTSTTGTTTSSTQATTSTTRVTTSTTSSTTRPEPPLAAARWRLFVRISRTAGSDTNVDVPKRSVDAPLDVMIRADHVAAFRVGDQMTGAEIQALGEDTFARLTAAAAAYLRARPADYPGLKAVVELRWAARES
jgi:hypothetical protein